MTSRSCNLEHCTQIKGEDQDMLATQLKQSVCNDCDEALPTAQKRNAQDGWCRQVAKCFALALPILCLHMNTLQAQGQVTLTGVAFRNGLWGSDITDLLTTTSVVSWVTGTFRNYYSYDVEVSYSITLDGTTIASGSTTVWGGYSSTTYEELDPPQSFTAGPHFLSLISGSAHFDRGFVVSSSENHQPTNIVLSSTNVIENLGVGTKVGHFNTQDPDAGNTFTYTLVAGTGSGDNGSFTINGSNLLTAAIFNYEVKSNFSIRVQSVDQGSLSTQTVFAINVVDVDETPVFYGPSEPTNGNIVLRWSSVTNHLYTVHYSTNLLTGFSVLQSNIPASPAVNSYTDSVLTVPQRFWKITTDQ